MTEEFLVDRRQRQDGWVKFMRYASIVAWILFIISLVVSYYAAPDTDYGILRYYDIEIRKFWLTPLTGYLYVLLWISALLSYLTIVLHKYRSRRKTDNSSFNIALLFFVSLSWVIYIAINLMS